MWRASTTPTPFLKSFSKSGPGPSGTPAQPEILRYLNYVADRFGLRGDIDLETRVTAATFDDSTSTWSIETDTHGRVRARFCVMATGCLSAPRTLDFPGLSTFEGESYRTSEWPDGNVDWSGKRVAVIGTGSSGVQTIPVVAETAEHLYVFQRSANYSVPARNRPVLPQEDAEIKFDYPEHRRVARTTPSALLRVPQSEERRRGQRDPSGWPSSRRGGARRSGFVAAFADILRNPASNEFAADFVRGKIARLVKNPEVARELMPNDHPIGTKRLCADTNYYATYNRDNVTLVKTSGSIRLCSSLQRGCERRRRSTSST